MSRVAVAMSGGVDSSVAALLLTQAGREVVGVTMRLVPGACDADYPGKSCCSLEAIERARTTCRRLGIPYYTLNLVADFEREVIADFCRAYAAGRTPNPCLRCNERIKFGVLWRRMAACGFDAVATGHYAIREQANDRLVLRRGKDRGKDQSYALYGMDQTQLSHALFPLGTLDKQQVRDLARRHGLPTAEAPESQDLCFVPSGNYRDFLAARVASTPGPICDQRGTVIGRHDGLYNYTVGQRVGLGLRVPGPLYVIGADADRGTMTVGPREALPRCRCTLTNVNWVSLPGPHAGETVVGEAAVRYRSTPALARLTVISDDAAQVHLPENPNTLTPGQSLVLYQGDVVVAGGVIERAWN